MIINLWDLNSYVSNSNIELCIVNPYEAKSRQLYAIFIVRYIKLLIRFLLHKPFMSDMNGLRSTFIRMQFIKRGYRRRKLLLQYPRYIVCIFYFSGVS